jgi:membrane fusion protein, multidrug efflux system
MPVLSLRSVSAVVIIAVSGTIGVYTYLGKLLPWPLDYANPLIAKLTGRSTVDVTRQAAPAAGNDSGSRAAGAPAGGRPPVTIVTAKAERKPTPIRLESIGTVQTISTVAVRARVDSQIMEVPFQDGGMVSKGDILFRLDSRQVEALIKQAEANIAKDKATLAQAESDLTRTETLVRRDFATDQRLDTAKALVATTKASIRGNEALLENLNVQLTFYTIVAPISGRISVAALKAGNIAKQGDASAVLTTINQISPIYVSFSLPQRHLPEIRQAMDSGEGRVLATPQGFAKGAEGKIAVIDNSVDATTGTIPMRAVFDNPGELLWPGALTQVRLTLKTEPNALVVPREAIQTGQNGTFLFTVNDGVAKTVQVVVDRIVDGIAVLSSGLSGGETVVIDGQLILTDGAKVIERPPGNRPGSGAPRPATTTSQTGGQG